MMRHNPNSNGSSATSQRQVGFSKNYKGKCQLCSQQGHFARYCPLLHQQWTYNPPSSLSGSHRGPAPMPYVSIPQAYYSGPTPQLNNASPTSSSRWLVDSGASHHIAMDLQNLTSHSKIYGREEFYSEDHLQEEPMNGHLPSALPQIPFWPLPVPKHLLCIGIFV